MNAPKLRAAVVVLGLFGLAISCGRNSPPAAEGESSARPPRASRTVEQRPAKILPIPQEGASGQAAALPPGHPPIEGAGGFLAWQVPTGWIEEAPSSPMRRAQYRVPGPGGDGECVVFYFGPGQGGDAMANARRWASQFQQPDGRPSEEVMKTRHLDDAGVHVLLVEVTGTYDGGMTMTDAPATPKPGWMLLGAIAEGPDANWFFKFTGPEPTVRAEREAFERMVRSLRPAR
jgi:hypothetical protein